MCMPLIQEPGHNLVCEPRCPQPSCLFSPLAPEFMGRAGRPPARALPGTVSANGATWLWTALRPLPRFHDLGQGRGLRSAKWWKPPVPHKQGPGGRMSQDAGVGSTGHPRLLGQLGPSGEGQASSGWELFQVESGSSAASAPLTAEMEAQSPFTRCWGWWVCGEISRFPRTAANPSKACAWALRWPAHPRGPHGLGHLGLCLQSAGVWGLAPAHGQAPPVPVDKCALWAGGSCKLPLASHPLTASGSLCRSNPNHPHPYLV